MDTRSEPTGCLNQYNCQNQPTVPSHIRNQAASKKTIAGHTVSSSQTDIDILLKMPFSFLSKDKKKIANYSIVSSQPENSGLTTITFNDDNDDNDDTAGCITDLFKEIENSGIVDHYLSMNGQNSMTPGEYYSLIEKKLTEVEWIANQEKGGSLSCAKKTVYSIILLASAIGASSNVLGIIPLGVEATPRDRAIGITQFVLAVFFAHGVSHANTMYSLVRKVDRQLTRWLHASREGCGAKFSIVSHIRESISKMNWKDTSLYATALCIAFYAPLQSALNSRNGGINLITGNSQDPSLKIAGEAVGNTLMVLNWAAGTSLTLMMASSLFDGYKKDLETLWNGASAEQIHIEKLVTLIRKQLINDSFYGANASLTKDRLIPLADPEISESYLFALALLNAQSQEDSSELPPELHNLLADLGLDTPEKQQQAITYLEKRLGPDGSRHINSRAQLISILSKALESPKLNKIVLARLAGESAKYSNSSARAQAVLRLLVRLITNWLALNCLALTLVTPSVVNHYKGYMEDPSANIDCQALQALFNASAIEPFDDSLFELGLGAYMAKGFSLSSSAVKSLEILMIPLSFILSGCNMDNMTRAWKTIFRDFDGLSTAAGLIGVCVYNWIISSAGNKYQEYLELLGCDIGVPDSPMVEEFDNGTLITQILMTLIYVHLYITSFKSMFRRLPLRFRPRPCNSLSATDAETARKLQPVASPRENQKDEEQELIHQVTAPTQRETAV